MKKSAVLLWPRITGASRCPSPCDIVTPGMKRTASAMLCIDWSAMTERVSTVADCGVSRSGVSVFVAVRDVVAA